MAKPSIKDLGKKVFGKLGALLKKIPVPSFEGIYRIFSSWGKLIGITLLLIIFLYYPLGGFMVNKIDTGTAIEINETDRNKSASIEMMSYIINREVNQNSWTPNLPFIFPSYFLDNMPNFQLGVMSSVAQLSKKMAPKLERNTNSDNLSQAAEFLQYPGTIWMFSPQNKLTPVPSAHSQYRKARKNLIKFNQKLDEGYIVFNRSSDDLSSYIKGFSSKITASMNKIDNHIREESSSYIDNKADDLFYHTQGMLYADYLLLKALAFDYQNIIVEKDLYPDWTKMLKALEKASEMSPTIVRNGKKDSTLAPNHLANIGFYALRSQIYMQKIIRELEKNNIPEAQ